MRRQELQKRRRKDLIWYGLGFLVMQLGLAVGVDACWPFVRDPDFSSLEQIVAARRAEAPDRPFFLVLGSSRTLWGLEATKLNDQRDPTAPLVLNCSMLGAGPMMKLVMLRRLLDVGQRPDLVFLEVVPMALSARDGPPIEERQKFTGRFSLTEMARLYCYYAQPHRLVVPWCFSRLLPVDRSQAELHDALGIDRAPDQGLSDRGRDAYGWSGCPRKFSPAEVEAQTKASLVQYHTALTQPVCAPGAVQAMRDTVTFCQDRHIAIEFFVPPEGSVFREYNPAVTESQLNAVRDLARELGVHLTDGRCWVDDNGFWDGHHTTVKGADQFTARFRREVLAPHLSPRPSPTATTVANRTDRGSKPRP